MSCRSITSTSSPSSIAVGRPARLAIERVDWQAGLLVRRRRDLVVEHAADAVLGAEERDQFHVLGAEQQIDCSRRRPARARVIGHEAHPLPAQRREPSPRRTSSPVSTGNETRGTRRPTRRSRGRSTPAARAAGGKPVTAAAATVATRARSGVTSPFPSGWTRFDRKTTNMPVDGSIQSDVPVKPGMSEGANRQQLTAIRRERRSRCPSRGPARSVRIGRGGARHLLDREG